MDEVFFWILATWFCWARWRDYMDFEQARHDLSKELADLLDKRP